MEPKMQRVLRVMVVSLEDVQDPPESPNGTPLPIPGLVLWAGHPVPAPMLPELEIKDTNGWPDVA